MIEKNKIEILIETGKKVFRIADLKMLWKMEDYFKVVDLAGYYATNNRIFRVKQGLYSVTEKPDILEVAQKLFSPSYITYHTALAIHGINFQYYSEIHCVSKRKKIIEVLGQKIIYHQVRDDILFNFNGVLFEDNYYLASPERAICDSLYLNPFLAFDNLEKIDKTKLYEIAKIYNQKSLFNNLNKIF